MNDDNIKEIWRFRELLYFLALRDVKIRYKQAVLGVAWAILQPLFAMIIFSLVFGRVAGIHSDGVPYPLFAFCALVPWTYFSGTVSLGGNSLISNSNLITKVYFPRVLLPAASALGGMIDFCISSVFLLGMLIYYRIPLGRSMLLAPLFVAGTMLLAFSVSMLLAALNVRYRDVKHAITFLIQIWLFATPIIYPVASLSKRLQTVMAFNPLAGMIDGFRASIIPSQPMDLTLVASSIGITLALFLVGMLYFRKTEQEFADII
jgi:lipopolysaccharide transport system permease protein